MNAKILVVALLSAVLTTSNAQGGVYNVACGFPLKASNSVCTNGELNKINKACRDGLGDTGLVTLASVSDWKLTDPQGNNVQLGGNYNYEGTGQNVQTRTIEQAAPVDKVEGGFRRKLQEAHLRQRKLCAYYNWCQLMGQYCSYCSCCSGKRRRGLQVTLDEQQARHLQNVETSFKQNVKDRLTATTNLNCVDINKVDVDLSEQV